MNDLKEQYYNWLVHFIADRDHNINDYQYLLGYLISTDFTYTIEMDANREEDGFDLRYRFGNEKHYDHRVIANELDDRPCSVLEMMVALALRCEETTMSNTHYGDRTSFWFWGMVNSLGLDDMTDDRFRAYRVENAVNRFLSRRYARNGIGGLFITSDPSFDMRSTEIWYQCQKYLNEL